MALRADVQVQGLPGGQPLLVSLLTGVKHKDVAARCLLRSPIQINANQWHQW